jgi:hypothetical protein
MRTRSRRFFATALMVALAVLGSSLTPAVSALSSEGLAAAAIAKPRITSHPKSSLAAQGRYAELEVRASGSGLRYMWQQRDPGRSWAKVAGARSRSLLVKVVAPSRQYSVVVSNAGGSVRSRVAIVFLVSCFGAASMPPAKAGCPTANLAGLVRPSPQTVWRDWGGLSSCWAGNDTTRLIRCQFPSSGSRRGVPHLALVGDSHARMYIPALRWLASRGALTFDTYLKGSCAWSTVPPVRGTIGTAHQREFTASCATWRKKLAARLIRTPGEYDGVITTAARITRVLYPRSADTQAERNAFRRDGAAAAWKPVLRRGIPVFVIRDNPMPGTPTASCLLTRGKDDPGKCAFSRKAGLKLYDPLPGAVARSGSRAHLVDLTSRFCTDTRCLVVIGGANVYRDDHHVAVTYTRTLAPYIWRKVSRYL